ncbi:ciliary microtubule inner protein 1-like [Montipora capricornis]|uniref:ciliary microtubule inner protein 1-like n=1 Tax=Montipora foliosa TaxID=591990 RepID=UPI0035F1914B
MVFGKTKAGFNFVHQDQIWKDHIGHEHSAAKRWPENWGFLVGQYKILANEDDSVENGAAAVRVKQRREALKLPPIDSSVASQLSVGKSNAKFPIKTSEEVGWRSSQRHCSLEKYGRYTKLKTSFLGQMKWPPEAVD